MILCPWSHRLGMYCWSGSRAPPRPRLRIAHPMRWARRGRMRTWRGRRSGPSWPAPVPLRSSLEPPTPWSPEVCRCPPRAPGSGAASWAPRSEIRQESRRTRGWPTLTRPTANLL